MAEQRKGYPNCGGLGSDVAEIQAFSAWLDMVAMLEGDGHTRQCAELILADNAECSCGRAKGGEGKR